MISLTLSEATILKRFLDDPDGKLAIRQFFDKQRLYHAERCKDEMLAGKEDEAKKAACFCLAYETAYLELGHFAENQLRQVS